MESIWVFQDGWLFQVVLEEMAPVSQSWTVRPLQDQEYVSRPVTEAEVICAPFRDGLQSRRKNERDFPYVVDS